MTLAVLEAKMPEYFAGGSEVYFKNKEVKRFRQKNNYKLPVSDEVMEIMRTNFTHEIELKPFAKTLIYHLENYFESLQYKYF